MTHQIVMPQLGLTMTEGTVTTWLKQPGERVEKGEMLFTVETDKVDMEVESTASGYLSTTIEAGKLVAVGTVIATIADKPAVETQPSSNEALGDPPQTAEFIHAAAPNRDRPASPRARALAKSLGIDIKEIPASGGSRIVEEDVRRFEAARPHAKSQPPLASPTRRITAERTSQSFTRAPHFYLGAEVNAAKLVTLREQLQATAQRRLGAKLTYTDFLLKALALALTEHPEVNAYWEAEAVISRDSINVGLAAQTPAGLLVPVIHKADTLSLFAIAALRHELTEQARLGKLNPDRLSGGSATLSNLGHEGVDWFQAILNPPQSVILASGALKKRPMVVNGALQAEYSLILTLSVDHRVLDGVAGAKFLKTIKRTLEDPHELLV